MKIEGLKTKRRKIRDSSQYKCVSVDYELQAGVSGCDAKGRKARRVEEGGTRIMHKKRDVSFQ